MAIVCLMLDFYCEVIEKVNGDALRITFSVGRNCIEVRALVKCSYLNNIDWVDEGYSNNCSNSSHTNLLKKRRLYSSSCKNWLFSLRSKTHFQ